MAFFSGGCWNGGMTADMLELLRSVPRADFLPESARRRADVDAPLPIGHGQTNSQPSTVARMLELLDVRPGHRVLDVGCGSGWTTALLARLAGSDGEVHAVERIPELVATARRNTAPFGVPAERIGEAVPGVLGMPEEAPFDRILLSAMGERMPAALVEQLAEDGVLVGPWAGRMHRVVRTRDGLESSEHGGYSFVPLIL